MSEVWSHPQWKPVILAATREGIRIAQAEGIAVCQTLEARAVAFFAASGAHRPSVLKHPGELPAILPPLMQAAQRHRIAAPALHHIAAVVKPSNALAAKG
jgi:ketopantoate reductase